MFLFLFLTIFYFFFWLFIFFLLFSYNYLRVFSYFFFIIFFLLGLFLFLIINKSIFWYQVIFKFYSLSSVNMSYIIGLDSISIFLIILSIFLLMFCFVAYWFLKYRLNFYVIMLFISLWLLINVFSVLDFFFFYIFFEGIIIPMFFLIVCGEVVHVKYMLLINFFYIHYLVQFLYYYLFLVFI